MSTYRTMLEKTPAPCALYGMGLTPQDPQHVDWLMKVHTDTLDLFGSPPQLTLKAGQFFIRPCIIVVLLFQIGSRAENPIICGFLNGFNDNFIGLDAMRQLQRQPQLNIHVFDERLTPKRHIVLDNCAQQFFNQAVTHIERAEPWSMSMFDRARAQLEQNLPTPQAIWTQL